MGGSEWSSGWFDDARPQSRKRWRHACHPRRLQHAKDAERTRNTKSTAIPGHARWVSSGHAQRPSPERYAWHAYDAVVARLLGYYYALNYAACIVHCSGVGTQ